MSWKNRWEGPFEKKVWLMFFVVVVLLPFDDFKTPRLWKYAYYYLRDRIDKYKLTGLFQNKDAILTWSDSFVMLNHGRGKYVPLMPYYLGLGVCREPTIHVLGHVSICRPYFQVWRFPLQNKTILRLSYQYNGNFYFSKTASLYWDRPWALVLSFMFSG